MLVSGGVDSTVCAALLHRALKEDQVIALHIDNGFMRKDESKKVLESLRKIGLALRGKNLQFKILMKALEYSVFFFPFIYKNKFE